MMYPQIIDGIVGREPEGLSTPSGKFKINFSVAVDSGYGDNKRTEWFQVEAWNETARAVQDTVHKGTKILALADKRTDEWQDKKTGEKKSRAVFSLKTFGIVPNIERKSKTDPNHDQRTAYSENVADDDIPF